MLVTAVLLGAGATTATASAPIREDAALDRALHRLVTMPGGPPGAIAVVQRGRDERVHAAGVAELGDRRPPSATDHMHVASTAKAFSGGVALSLVDRGVLRLDDTIGARRPDLPRRWHGVTLGQLLAHTSGVPDFIASPAAQAAIGASLGTAPAPRRLLDFVSDQDLEFTPGSRYAYSNSDNIVVGLFVESATGRSYERELQSRVAGPLGLRDTTLPAGPALPRPFLHGYEVERGAPPADVSEVLAGGWAWASGGVVSTPRDLNRFVRGYVGGELFGRPVQEEQARFVRGGSEPPGPGRNSAGLGLFRYETPCGTVYGHTGNTLGYTQFAVASRDGQRSATVSITAQRTQKSTGRDAAVFAALRAAELDAVCAAMARR